MITEVYPFNFATFVKNIIMSLGIGDKVRFLNDVGGGTIVKILSKNMVLVQDADEFEYPYPEKELVLVEKAVKEVQNVVKSEERNIESQVNQVIDEPEITGDNISEILFGFLRKKTDEFDGFEAYLVNDSDFYMFYHIVLRGDDGINKIDANVLEPNIKISVGTLSREQINLSKEVIIQIVFYDHPYQTLHDMVERKIKIVPLKFFQEHVFIDNDFFDEKAYLFELLVEKPGLGESVKTQEDFENNLERKDKDESEEDKSKRFKPRKTPETIEVDLHINSLVDSVIGMSNAEIIQKQMNVFHSTITDAITRKAGKVILIHGIGNGTLKDAIRESLQKQYKLHYEDASFREYGFGATEVMM